MEVAPGFFAEIPNVEIPDKTDRLTLQAKLYDQYDNAI